MDITLEHGKRTTASKTKMKENIQSNKKANTKTNEEKKKQTQIQNINTPSQTSLISHDFLHISLGLYGSLLDLLFSELFPGLSRNHYSSTVIINKTAMSYR